MQVFLLDTLRLVKASKTSVLNEEHRGFVQRFERAQLGLAGGGIDAAAGGAAAAAGATGEAPMQVDADAVLDDDDAAADDVDVDHRDMASLVGHEATTYKPQGAYKLRNMIAMALDGQDLSFLGDLNYHDARDDAIMLRAGFLSPASPLAKFLTLKATGTPAFEFDADKQAKYDKTIAVINHPLPPPWQAYNEVKHDIPRTQRAGNGELINGRHDDPAYDGEMAGPAQHLRGMDSLADLFGLYMTEDELKTLVANSNEYANEYVKSVNGKLVPCDKNAPGARKRHAKIKDWQEITVPELLTTIGLRFRQSALRSRSIGQGWETKYALGDLVMSNNMTGKRFRTIMRFLHPESNAALDAAEKAAMADAANPQPGIALTAVDRKHPLRKIRGLLARLNTRLATHWKPGEFIAGDESRMTCTGRGGHVLMRYNANKPIKHGANLYMICCGETGVPLQFLVQCAADGHVPRSVMTTLVKAAGLSQPGADASRRRTLVTDSHYAYEEQAVELLEDHGVGFLATYTLPRKPTVRRAATVHAASPFTKNPPAVDARIPRGQHRFAFKKTPSGTWMMRVAVKDKRRFGLMSTVRLGEPSPGKYFMSRRTRGVRLPRAVPSFPALLQYLKNYNGVDLADRGVADFTTQYRINRYYMRLFWYCMDLVSFALWKIAQARIPEDRTAGKKKSAREHPFAAFHKNTGNGLLRGRTKFMIALSNALLTRAKRMDGTLHDMQHAFEAKTGAKRRCPVCESLATGANQLERRAGQVANNAGKCDECNSVMCEDCFRNRWNHATCSIYEPADMPAAAGSKSASPAAGGFRTPPPPAKKSPKTYRQNVAAAAATRSQRAAVAAADTTGAGAASRKRPASYAGMDGGSESSSDADFVSAATPLRSRVKRPKSA